MKGFHRSATLAVLAVLALLAVTTTASFARSHVVSHAKTRQLTIRITNTGSTVWGTVSMSPGAKTCSLAACTYKVPAGQKVTLAETPTSPSTWPFGGWIVNGHSKGSGSKLTVKLSKKSVVKATYFFSSYGR